ncbi:MAG: hypothetical protein JWQ43_2380 [Glaciihabitans sp.]|nr:hypothetical protein [Glaciihabitans sp.]
MTHATPSSYPEGEAGPDSQTGPVDAFAPDGADESVPGPVSLAEDGSLSANSSATGSPTSMNGELTGGSDEDEVPEVEPDTANPNALIEGNRVATAEDME